MSEKVGGHVAPHGDAPLRQASSSSDHGAVPQSDPNDTSTLLAERLQAWKHAVGYLEEYVGATEKLHRAQSKEYEKVFKTIQNPLKEGHHFDQSLGGVAGMFEMLRANTQGLVNSHLETEKNLKGAVQPILERLHKEIKNKAKELSAGAAKSAKEVEKARNMTQKHIELLGQQTASHDSAGGRQEPLHDPYIVQRGVIHRLYKQVLEENNNKNDLIAVQNNFSTFEAHVIEVIQQAMMSFSQFVGSQAQKTQMIYADMVSQGHQIPPDFEWQQFNVRSSHLLIDPSTPDRSIESINFPNQNHRSTKPVLEGTLERKSRNKLSMAGYTSAHYVVTSSRFLHEFKDTDNFRKDPTPDLSIYLPDAVIGATNGDRFNVKGKDVAGGFGSKLSGSSEIAFKAHSAEDALKWFEVIRCVVGASPAHDVTSPGGTRASSQTHPPSYFDGEEEFVPKSLDPNPRPPSPTYPISHRLSGGPRGMSNPPLPIRTSTGVIAGPTVESPVAAEPAASK